MRIAIVGAGITGIRAAQILEQAGENPTLFEARSYLGGRTKTANPKDQVKYEAGGEWLDSDHCRTIAWIESLGLKLQPRTPLKDKFIHKGQSTTTPWQDCEESEQAVEQAAKQICRTLRKPAWKNEDKKDLDAQTVDDFIRSHATSGRGHAWVTAKYRSDEGEDLTKVGLLGWLAGFTHYVDRAQDVASAYRVQGGLSEAVHKAANTLAARPVLNAPLRRVEQSPGKVRLSFEGHEAEFDRVIITLPPRAISQVDFNHQLDHQICLAQQSVGAARAIKIAWQFRSKWWEAEGWSGGMFCDGPVQQTWDAGLDQAPVLTAYVCGEAALHWLAQKDPVQSALAALEIDFPAAKDEFVQGWLHDWVTDPFSQGAFSYFPPGYVLGPMRHAAQPQSRLHFAGEHTAEWSGFIEGALESAERAAAEVMNA